MGYSASGVAVVTDVKAAAVTFEVATEAASPRDG